MDKQAIVKILGALALFASQVVFVSGPAQALLSTSSNPLSAGVSSTCVIRAADDLYCVGSNTFGQLGIGNQISTTDPKRVLGLSKVSSVSVGATSACAVTHTGELYCWGDNSFGQLGLGDNQNRNTATRVSSLSAVSQVAVGDNFACALRSNGALSCWGGNDAGQLTSETMQSSLSPALASLTPNGITQFAISGKRVCVLASDIYCWGEFASYRVAGEVKNWLPTKLLGSNGAKSLKLGSDFGCFTFATGASCWGSNDHGQLGVGSKVSSDTPVPVTGISSVKDLTVGKSFACVLDINNDTFCWGDNQYGQLVVSSRTDQLTRIPTGAPKAANIEAGSNNLCLLKLDAAVFCYGDSSAGQSGFLLASKSILTNSNVSNASRISTGLSTTCAIDSSGTLSCWGDLIPVIPKGLHFTDVSVGDSSACAVSFTKKVLCWGTNSTGQLGNNSFRSSIEMVEISSLGTNFIKVAVGYRHACAVTETGLSYCWGDNSRQQLGAVGADSRVPIGVPGIGTAVSISSGDYHSCVIQAGGSAVCWGDNSKRQINSTNINLLSPTSLVMDNPASSLALGTANTCLLDTTKSLKCIGDNAKKQSPGLVSGSYLSASTGGNTVCAISTDEKVYCFGSADSEKLVSVLVDTAVPSKISDDAFNAVSVGTKHVCVIDKGGKLSCWGSNTSGQLTSSFGFPKAFADLMVSISGTQAFGEKLKAVVTSAETKAQYSYLWKRASTSNGLSSNLTSQTTDSYVLAGSDLGKLFAAEVKQSKWCTSSAAQSSEFTNAISSPIRLLMTPVPIISGTAKVGRIFSVRAGMWDSGAKLTYQWYRGKTLVKGATRVVFSVTSADVNKQIYVAVTGTKAGLPKVTVKSLKTPKIVR